MGLSVAYISHVVVGSSSGGGRFSITDITLLVLIISRQLCEEGVLKVPEMSLTGLSSWNRLNYEKCFFLL